MKRITVFLFACLLIALPFSSLYAQKIEGEITEFEYNYDTETYPPKQRKFSYDKISLERVKDNAFIKVKTGNENLTLIFTSTKVGKYISYSPYSIMEDAEFSKEFTCAA
jgi:hypothetical protein